jgi:aqualysin 1
MKPAFRRIRRLGAPLFAASMLAMAIATLLQPSAAAQPGDVIPGRYIVTFAPSVGDPQAETDALVRAHGGTVHYRYSHALKGFAASLPERAVEALRNTPRVASVEADREVHLTDAGTQSPTPSWGLDRIDQRNLPLNNSFSYTTVNPLKVYIIDTGILTTHADFGGRAVDGYDAIDGALPAADCNGHGTHVAGTVGGAAYGVAKNVTLVAVRVLACNGGGTSSGVIAGIDWVTGDHQAGVPAVANMSLGGGANSALDAAVNNSIADGVVYAVAAGNDAVNACNASPARTPNALTVGATTSTDARASYSNIGSCLDIFAPGSGITSAWLGNSNTATNTISGTSMATPHVAGAAALYLQANPSASPATVASALTSAATVNVVTSAGTGSPNRLLYVAAPTGPSAPGASTLSATAGNAVVNLSWNTPSDGGSAITGYKIYRGTSAGGTSLYASVGVQNVYADSGVTNGTTYFYLVRAVNSVGDGAPSNEVSATPQPPATVPGAPALTGTANSGWVQVQWTTPADGGSPITKYIIERASGGAVLTRETEGSVNSMLDDGLTNGVTYTYRVAAVNVVGTGPQSAPLALTPQAAPVVTPPAAPVLSGAAGNAVANLSWTVPDNGGAAILGYRIYRGASSGTAALFASVGAASTTYADTTAANGVTYFYQVRAHNDVGDGTLSNEVSVTPVAPPVVTVPSAPLNLSAVPASGRGVQLSWQVPLNNGGSAITEYRIFRGTSSGAKAQVAVSTGLSFKDTATVRGVRYYYEVRAVNVNGPGAFSNEANAVAR